LSPIVEMGAGPVSVFTAGAQLFQAAILPSSRYCRLPELREDL
jgi:hypothetical protein